MGKDVATTSLCRIPSNHRGYFTTDITFASYIHTEVNTHKDPSDTGHIQAYSTFPQLIHEDHSRVHREYHSDLADLKAWDVYQPR